MDRFVDKPQPPAEPTPHDFGPRDQQRVRREHENFIEAADRLQRDLDRDATPQSATQLDPYLALPIGVRANYSRAEYLWLSDAEKSTLVQRECEPEC